MTKRIYPSPIIDAESEPFWTGAAQGKLMLRRCGACGEVHYFPRAKCPFCHAPDTEWIAASGEGEIHSLSNIMRADPPYTIAYVQLAEGPCMLTNIVDAEADKLAIGQAVRLKFVAAENDAPIPVFAPV